MFPYLGNTNPQWYVFPYAGTTFPYWYVFPYLGNTYPCVPLPGKHISLVICVPLPRRHISLVICVPLQGKHTSLEICVPLPRKHMSLVICAPLPRKHISLVICVPLPRKHINPSDMCSPTRGMLNVEIGHSICLRMLNENRAGLCSFPQVLTLSIESWPTLFFVYCLFWTLMIWSLDHHVRPKAHVHLLFVGFRRILVKFGHTASDDRLICSSVWYCIKFLFFVLFN